MCCAGVNAGVGIVVGVWGVMPVLFRAGASDRARLPWPRAGLCVRPTFSIGVRDELGMNECGMNGPQLTMTAIAIDRIAGGKIVETWLKGDDLGVLQQLGVMPQPGQAVG